MVDTFQDFGTVQVLSRSWNSRVWIPLSWSAQTFSSGHGALCGLIFDKHEATSFSYLDILSHLFTFVFKNQQYQIFHKNSLPYYCFLFPCLSWIACIEPLLHFILSIQWLAKVVTPLVVFPILLLLNLELKWVCIIWFPQHVYHFEDEKNNFYCETNKRQKQRSV